MSGEKPDACPNPECKSGRPRVMAGDVDGVESDWWVMCDGVDGCNMQGPVSFDSPGEAVRLWNRLPRAAGRGDLM